MFLCLLLCCLFFWSAFDCVILLFLYVFLLLFVLLYMDRPHIVVTVKLSTATE